MHRKSADDMHVNLLLFSFFVSMYYDLVSIPCIWFVILMCPTSNMIWDNFTTKCVLNQSQCSKSSICFFRLCFISPHIPALMMEYAKTLIVSLMSKTSNSNGGGLASLWLQFPSSWELFSSTGSDILQQQGEQFSCNTLDLDISGLQYI